MAIKARDIDGIDERGDARPAPAARAGGGVRVSGAAIPRVYGAALLLFGLPLWPVAAWYLAGGWRAMLNAVLAFLHQDYALPALAGLIGLGVAIAVGALYSRIELHPPLRERDWRRAALLWLVWLLVMGSDVWATFRGLERPTIVGGVLAAVLTFGPDQAIMRGWRILMGRPPF